MSARHRWAILALFKEIEGLPPGSSPGSKDLANRDILLGTNLELPFTFAIGASEGYIGLLHLRGLPASCLMGGAGRRQSPWCSAARRVPCTTFRRHRTVQLSITGGPPRVVHLVGADDYPGDEAAGELAWGRRRIELKQLGSRLFSETTASDHFLIEPGTHFHSNLRVKSFVRKRNFQLVCGIGKTGTLPYKATCAWSA